MLLELRIGIGEVARCLVAKLLVDPDLGELVEQRIVLAVVEGVGELADQAVARCGGVPEPADRVLRVPELDGPPADGIAQYLAADVPLAVEPGGEAVHVAGPLLAVGPMQLGHARAQVVGEQRGELVEGHGARG